MNKSQIDEKGIVREVTRDYLRDTAPAELGQFELSFEGMYDVMAPGPCPSQQPEANGAALSGGQLVDATVIAASLWAGKSMFWLIADPLLEQRLLPNLDVIEAKLRELGRPELVRSIRIRLEAALRKHLGKPSQPT